MKTIFNRIVHAQVPNFQEILRAMFNLQGDERPSEKLILI